MGWFYSCRMRLGLMENQSDKNTDAKWMYGVIKCNQFTMTKNCIASDWSRQLTTGHQVQGMPKWPATRCLSPSRRGRTRSWNLISRDWALVMPPVSAALSIGRSPKEKADEIGWTISYILFEWFWMSFYHYFLHLRCFALFCICLVYCTQTNIWYVHKHVLKKYRYVIQSKQS